MTGARRALGARGEELAARWYAERGYEIVARNWRCAAGELDLVVRNGRTVVFCEVKTRSSDRFGSPFDAVTPVKQQRIRRLAVAFLREHGVHAPDLRFDVAAVRPGSVDVVEGAF